MQDDSWWPPRPGDLIQIRQLSEPLPEPVGKIPPVVLVIKCEPMLKLSIDNINIIVAHPLDDDAHDVTFIDADQHTRHAFICCRNTTLISRTDT